jgi:hypothetical protein
MKEREKGTAHILVFSWMVAVLFCVLWQWVAEKIRRELKIAQRALHPVSIFTIHISRFTIHGLFIHPAGRRDDADDMDAAGQLPH